MKFLALSILILSITLCSAHVSTKITTGLYVFLSNMTGNAITTRKGDWYHYPTFTHHRLRGHNNQIFFVNNTKGNFFTIQAINHDKFLTVPEMSTGDITLVNDWYNDTINTHQQWSFESRGNGLFAIKSRSSGKYFTLRNESDEAYQTAFDGQTHQLFRPLHLDCNTSVPIQDGSTYAFFSNSPKLLALDVTGIWTRHGALVQGWSFWGGLNQYFQARLVGNDTYNLVALHSGKALSVDRSDTREGSEIIQANLGTGDEQLWYFNMTRRGTYRITNVLTRKVLTVEEYQGGVSTHQRYTGERDQEFFAVEIK